ncbi:MAG: acyl-ACP--UDP-N-acetylglucosamine O-acyltransferase, partial [Verrucomicrobia bacterium]|nr:acyl-ACP--UDP-N-acetylglucosamine O-acyltransferase [Verrucomicrobiota bacterium]
HTVIGDDVTIGDGTQIGPHVSIMPHTRIGSQCQIHAGAVLSDLPQDLSFSGGLSYVKIGNNCVIREGVTIHRGTKPDSETVIGDGCFLMGYAHCAHNVTLGNKVIMANNASLAGYVSVGDQAFLSGACQVHQFVRIGRLAMLGGASGATKDVLPFMTMRPYALNEPVGPNTIGLRRAGIGADERTEIKRAMVLLTRSQLNPDEAIRQIRERCQLAVAEELCRFVETSARGVCLG